ncbi:MAG: TIM barrel protein [Clostridia bacterium]|nr:TIM barrel protein [Clostridia bacterium]
MKNIYIDTCVFPRSRLETGRIFRDRYGASLGFELLPMFDLQAFQANLDKNLDLFSGGPLFFHEPVFGVEHSVPKGSPAYEETMRHILLTKKYAELLHPSAMVYHFSNRVVPPDRKKQMLSTSLENLEEIKDLFPDVKILVENTGTRAARNLLLEQSEFTVLCLSRRLPVLIDIGHANANGWSLEKLIMDLHELIGGYHLHNNDGRRDLHNRLRDGTVDYRELFPLINDLTPGVPLIIEYTSPALYGDPLFQDIDYLCDLAGW